MRLPITLREVPPRLAAGAFILNSGLGKRTADEDTAKQLQQFAAGTYPVAARMQPKTFLKALSSAEIGLGVLILAPVVPAAVAGAALTGFSAGLLAMYVNTPGMRKPGSLAPTPQGLTISKDVWMLGIGLGLLADAATRARG